MGVDLIAGVMSVAEPAKLTKARAKLTEFSGRQTEFDFNAKLNEVAVSAEPAKGQIPDLLLDVMAHADRSKMEEATLGLASLEGGNAATQAAAREKVLKQFESTLLASSLSSMMPKSQDSLIGGGTTAEIWKGQQVQLMAEALSERSPLRLVGIFADAPSQPMEIAVNTNGAPSERIRSFVFGEKTDKPS